MKASNLFKLFIFLIVTSLLISLQSAGFAEDGVCQIVQIEGTVNLKLPAGETREAKLGKAKLGNRNSGAASGN